MDPSGFEPETSCSIDGNGPYARQALYQAELQALERIKWGLYYKGFEENFRQLFRCLSINYIVDELRGLFGQYIINYNYVLIYDELKITY